VKLDVCDAASIAEAMAVTGSVLVLVNNAGIGGDGRSLEEGSIEHGQRVFDTNYWGAIRMAQAVLPAMRAAGRGTIVNVTSILGLVTPGAAGHYTASKHALEAASEVLAQETNRFGIRIAIIEPGVILTPIFEKATDVPATDSPYFIGIRRLFSFFQAQFINGTLPEAVAAAILHAITTTEPKLRYTVGRDAAAMAAGRPAISGDDWVADFAIEDDQQFFDRMEQRFGIDLWRKPANLPR
jgi:NAD(P)-dependent dehydrogenase (short-subunit alcohol dehydrogenase family)